MSVLTAELRAWLKPGLAGVLAVADDEGRPEIARLWALAPLAGSDVVVVHVQRAVATRVIAIVGVKRRAAVNVVEVSSYRSRTLKGTCTPRAEIDHAFSELCIAAQGRAFASVGMPQGAAALILDHAASRELVAFALHVDSVFDQSPKPGAGAPL